MNFDSLNFDSLRPFIAKFIAPFVGFGIALLNRKWGIEFDATETGQMLTALVDLVVFAISTGFSAVGINKVVNPGNAASGHLAAKEKREVAGLKR